MDSSNLLNSPSTIVTIEEPKKNTRAAKKAVIVFCILAFVAIATSYYFYVQYAIVFNDKTIYYMYTDECPNCKIVKEYMNETNAEQKLSEIGVTFNKLNMDNPTSLPYLKKATKECEIPITSVGVPFVYYKRECFIGRVEVIDMLNKTISERY